MPFTIQDANKHKKGMTSKQTRQWTHIANSELSKCIKSGGTDETCAPKAIRYANGVIKKQQEERYQRDYGDKKRDEDFVELGDDLKSYIDTAISEWTKPVDEVDETDEIETETVEESCQECKEMKNKRLTELAKMLGEFDQEIRKYDQMICDAFRAQFKSPDPENGPWLYTSGVFIDHSKFGSGVIAELDGLYWLAPFEVDENEIVTFSGVETWKRIKQTWDFVDEKPVLPVQQSASEETATEPQELAEVEIKESDEPIENIKINEALLTGNNFSAIVVNESEYKDKKGNDRRSTLKVEMQPIFPGFGNSRDNNYYGKELLARVGKKFEGAYIFLTDHVEKEKNEKTKVGQFDEVIRYTQDGAPILGATIFDPDTAEKTRNRAEGKKLHTLECSIAAHGTSVKGEVNGKKCNIVKDIDEVYSVDFVSRAGAGGKTVGLLESEPKEVTPVAEPIKDDKVTEAETVVEETEAKPKETVIQEKETPQTPPKLSKDKAAELVNASTLPKESKERLLEMEYVDEVNLKEVITKEIDYVVKLTKSGKPFETHSVNQEISTKTHEERIAAINEKYGVNLGVMNKEV
jgi:hypothetical protein